MTLDIIKAIVLGIVEGLTEFIPVSSTGHLLLVQRFFGFADEDFGKTFAVLIQFGAILALLSIYFVQLWKLAIGFFSDPAEGRQRSVATSASSRRWPTWPRTISKTNGSGF